MLTALGVSALTIGLIEGAAEATALIVKVFSGVLSDWWGKRKPLALLGYGLGAIAKPLFALAGGRRAGGGRPAHRPRRQGHPGRAARCAGGRPRAARHTRGGIRSAPVARHRGCLPRATAGDRVDARLRQRFSGRVLGGYPAGRTRGRAAGFGVREPAGGQVARRVNPIRGENLRRLSGDYWWVVGIGAACTLARFSEAFLVLRAAQGGLPVALTPLVLIGMNLIYAASAYPFGKLSDRLSPHRAAGLGTGRADRGRCAPGVQQPLGLGVGRHLLLGPAPGHDPGPAGDDGGGHGAGRSARHRLWLLQSRQRTRDAGGQRPGRAPWAVSAWRKALGNSRQG
jgi:hypothetical protein